MGRLDSRVGLRLGLVVLLLGVVVCLRPSGCLLVRLVGRDSPLLATERVRQKNVLPRLSVLRDACFKPARRRRNNADSDVRL